MRPLDRRDFLLAAAGFAAMPLAGCVARAVRDADAPALIVHNAKITTLDPARPEASAFAARDGRFVAVGDSTDILALATQGTRLVDARGRRVIPGLTDTHTHTVRGGLNYALELRWDGVPSLALALDMLREQARRTPPGQWVRVVGGWSPEQFRERRMPTLEEINAASPDTPVFVLYLYTSALLNRACLRALGIDRRFPGDRYPGGRIVRDAQGEPTGMLLADPSAFILYSTLHDGPRLPTDEQLVSSRHFMKELNRLGITGALDCGGGFQNWPEDYAVVRELHRRDQLTVRIGASTFIQRPGRELEDFQNWTAQYTPRAGGRGFGDDRFYLLGAGEMLVLSAYDFEVFSRERVVPPAHAEAELEPVVRLLAERGWPFRFHATYDETVGRHLDVLERVHRDTPIDGLHWIVDHAETLSDRNIERIARLGGGVAIQNRVAFQEDAFLCATARRGRRGPAPQADPCRECRSGAGTDMSRQQLQPWCASPGS